MYDKSEYKWYQGNGICPICRKEALMGREKICPECRAKRTNARLANINRDEWNEYSRNLKRRIYSRRKEQGKCVYCGERSSRDGKVACVRCAIVQAERQRIYRVESSKRGSVD